MKALCFLYIKKLLTLKNLVYISNNYIFFKSTIILLQRIHSLISFILKKSQASFFLQNLIFF